MTTKKTKTAGKHRVKRLKLKKAKIRDLDARKRGKDVKGGWIPPLGVTYSCYTNDCSPPYVPPGPVVSNTRIC